MPQFRSFSSWRLYSDDVVKLIGGIACAVAVFSNCEVFVLSMRGSVSVVKSVGGRGAIVMVSSELVGGTSGSC